MKAAHPTRTQPALDLFGTRTESEQLLARDHPVLATRQAPALAPRSEGVHNSHRPTLSIARWDFGSHIDPNPGRSARDPRTVGLKATTRARPSARAQAARPPALTRRCHAAFRRGRPATPARGAPIPGRGSSSLPKVGW